jgi:hypothetical protein
MNTPQSDTVRTALSELRERCRELLDEPEATSGLELEDTDDPDRGSDPCNRLR